MKETALRKRVKRLGYDMEKLADISLMQESEIECILNKDCTEKEYWLFARMLDFERDLVWMNEEFEAYKQRVRGRMNEYI